MNSNLLSLEVELDADSGYEVLKIRTELHPVWMSCEGEGRRRVYDRS